MGYGGLGGGTHTGPVWRLPAAGVNRQRRGPARYGVADDRKKLNSCAALEPQGGGAEPDASVVHRASVALTTSGPIRLRRASIKLITRLFFTARSAGRDCQ